MHSENMQIDEDLGALVTSGLGKDTRRSAQFYLILLALAVVPIGAGYFFATQFGHRIVIVSDVLGISIPVRTIFYYVYICSGVVLAVALVFIQLLAREQVAKTAIFVYENGIEGVGIGPRIFRGDALQPFLLLYDQVSSVSLRQNAATVGILINAHDEAFSVYPPNTPEILEAINSCAPKIGS